MSIQKNNFVLAQNGKCAPFYYEEENFSGVKKIIETVAKDVQLVTGTMPKLCAIKNYADDCTNADNAFCADASASTNSCNGTYTDFAVICLTVGKSILLQKLVKQNALDISDLKNKNECFKRVFVKDAIPNVKNALVIIGSDKRGTIYGLFSISSAIGVSPYVNWANVLPAHQDTINFDETFALTSKEPSVKYRGFFINDEWPCFGNWCNKRFGGVNAKMYALVFELLLRFNGNYLWPAMWASCFAEDGPGLASAELADELGIVMGLSHHEPCLRHGEEYSKVRGKNSVYGDAWNFITNREGIIRFWRDGLKRNGHLENVITMGMRGERDSAIMGEKSTLADNIALLKDVITTQNELIKECVNADLQKVPRMLALYKEVEPFFYGTKDTKGLIGDKILDDIILLLCDDNHGYLRTVPNQKMRAHKAGYGMYYHFDYHGEPVSYEWTNSTYLPRVKEQMTSAYENGIQSLWIVNVGDLGLQEFALGYFMALAYDYDTWGKVDGLSTEDFTRQWMKTQFTNCFDDKDLDTLANAFTAYTRINHNRKPEHLGVDIYHASHFGEAENLLKECKRIIATIDDLYARCPANQKDAFYFLVYYNVVASLNLQIMWIYATWNKYLSLRGILAANNCADAVKTCLAKDEELKNTLHTINDGAWDGFALASHIGFCHWNDEECKNPVLHTVVPVAKKRLVAGLVDDTSFTSGGDWTKKVLHAYIYAKTDNMDANGSAHTNDGTNANAQNAFTSAEIFVALGGMLDTDYTITSDSADVKISCTQGVLSAQNNLQRITITYTPSPVQKNPNADVVVANLCIKWDGGNVPVKVHVLQKPYQVINASAFTNLHAGTINGINAHFAVEKNLGKTGDGLKTYPLFAHEQIVPLNCRVKPDKDTGNKRNTDTGTPQTSCNADACAVQTSCNADACAVQTNPNTNASSVFNKLPRAEYRVNAPCKDTYTVQFVLSPSNPPFASEVPKLFYSFDNLPVCSAEIFEDGYQAGVSATWSKGVLNHERVICVNVELDEGVHTLNYFGIGNSLVLEKIIIYNANNYKLPQSYFGPQA